MQLEAKVGHARGLPAKTDRIHRGEGIFSVELLKNLWKIGRTYLHSLQDRLAAITAKATASNMF